MSRHSLSKRDLLDYALCGATYERGCTSGLISETEVERLDKDIAEIERRIKLVDIAEERKEKS